MNGPELEKFDAIEYAKAWVDDEDRMRTEDTQWMRTDTAREKTQSHLGKSTLF